MDLSIETQEGLFLRVGLSSSTLNSSWRCLLTFFPRHFSLYMFRTAVSRFLYSTAHSKGLLCFSNWGGKRLKSNKHLAIICTIKLFQANFTLPHTVFNCNVWSPCNYPFIIPAKLSWSLIYQCCILHVNVASIISHIQIIHFLLNSALAMKHS